MVSVTYDHEFSYAALEGIGPVPMLLMTVAGPDRAIWLDVDACLDTGAVHTVFDGQIAVALGLDLYAGRSIPLVTALGNRLDARLHPVWLQSDVLGEFALEVAFSTSL